MEKRNFYAPDIDIYSLAQALETWFVDQEFVTQQFTTPDGGVTVQARKESTLRTLAGMSSAMSAVIRLEGEYVTVEMGHAKWVEKGAVAAVGMLVFWPALVTAGVGAYQQTQLQSKAWQYIEEFLRTNSAFADRLSFQVPGPTFGPSPGPVVGGAPPPISLGGNKAPLPAGGNPPPVATCAGCGHPLREGARFCDNCGSPVAVTCPGCGKQLRIGARFCDECGTPIQG
jgi:hypothetical protein